MNLPPMFNYKLCLQVLLAVETLLNAIWTLPNKRNFSIPLCAFQANQQTTLAPITNFIMPVESQRCRVFSIFPVCINSTAMAIFCKSFCRVLRKHLPKFAKCSIIQRHQQRRNNICGCGEIGRRAWFRFMWETMQVQVLSSAPEKSTHLSTKTMCAFFN